MSNIKRDVAITVSIFIALTVCFYFLGYWMIYRLGRATPLMLSVGLAAIATCLIRGRALSSLNWGWGDAKYQWFSYVIPLFIILTCYIVIWTFELGIWYNTAFVSEQREEYGLVQWNDFSIIIFHFILTATITIFLSLPSIIGEEIAWRGFLVTELSKVMSFTQVSLVSGFLWSVFHWPIMFLGLYGNSDTPMLYQLFCFTVFIMSASVIMTYLRYKTDSVWTAVWFHASLNAFMQKFFAPLTIPISSSSYFVDEFGAVLACVTLITAIIFWRKGVTAFSK